MKNLTRQRFEELASSGVIRKPSGHTPAGEDLCETALEFGLANGYFLADICHFYAHVQRKMGSLREEQFNEVQVLDAAYDKFVHDAAAFAGTLIDAAEGVKRRAVFAAVGSVLGKGVRILRDLKRLFL